MAVGIKRATSGEDPLNKLKGLLEQRNELQLKIVELATEFARSTCPFRAGDVIYTSRGLGLNGLVVDSVEMNPAYLAFGSMVMKEDSWVANTFAKNKDGTVSRRTVQVRCYDNPSLTPIKES